MKLLIIDDEINMCHMLKAMVERHGYQVDTANDGKSGLGLIKKTRFDFILCDVKMPKMDGIMFLREGESYLKESTVIMMSAYGSVGLALEAMKAGAYDFISKPFKTDEVLLTLKKAEEREQLKRENKKLKNVIEEFRNTKNVFGKMVAASPEMNAVFRMIEQVASYNTTVLVTGESGTGKELVARAIHSHSERCGKVFVAVNCGSFPENLLESELFGFVKGAFTGADRSKKGLFEEAHQATLFLDEIGELPVSMQVKLLRVLQESEIRPVGSNVTKSVDCRIIAATSRDLTKNIKEGKFREDLFYRLNVVTIKIPPLRERKTDIAVLVQYFVKKFNSGFGKQIKGFTSGAMKMIYEHHLPGNVRELENIVQRGIVLTESRWIETKHLPQTITEKKLVGRDNGDNLSLKLGQTEMEKEYIAKALMKCNGNKSKASLLLEISYPSLLSKIKEYRIG